MTAVVIAGGAGALMEPPLATAWAGATSTAVVHLSQSNWYWREQETNIGGAGVSPPSSLTDPSVPAGDLAVSGPEVNSQPDKETYLEFDLSAVPQGSTITSFLITLPVDKSGTNSPGQSAPPIVACSPKSSWSDGPGAQSFSAKPDDQCATDPPKVSSKDNGNSYTVDIAPIASTWSNGSLNLGVAITDDPQNTSTAYQVVFGPQQSLSKLTATVEYEPPASSSSSNVPGSPRSENDFAPSAPAPASYSTFAPLAELQANSPALPARSAPESAASSSDQNSAQTQSPATQSTTSAKHALGALSGSHGWLPPIGFWLAGIILVALLGAMSLVLGHPLVPAVLRPRRNLASVVLDDGSDSIAKEEDL